MLHAIGPTWQTRVQMMQVLIALSVNSTLFCMCAIAALDVYLSIMCVADKPTMSDPCSAVGSWDGTSYVKHW